MSERLARDVSAPALPGALWRDDRFAYLGTVQTAAIDAAGVPRVWAGARWADVSGTPWAEAVYRAAWTAEHDRATRAEANCALQRALPSLVSRDKTNPSIDAAFAPPPWRGEVRYLGQVDGQWSLLAWSDVLGRHVARVWSAADGWWRLAGEHRREAIYDAAFQHERAQVARLTRERDEAQRIASVATELARLNDEALVLALRERDEARANADGTCPACGGERYPDSRRGADE